MKLPRTSFTCAGDMLVARLIPTTYKGFDKIADYIKKGDVRFCNLETVLHKGENYGNQFNGGSFHGSDPRVLKIAREFGFNSLSFANNHTFDFGYGGLLSTLDELDNADFVHTGVGRNLDEAAAPAYIECEDSRVALISFTASFVNDAALAGKQSRRFPGRPGVNGLRLSEHVEVPEEHFRYIKDISDNSGINASVAISRKEGYTQTKESDTQVILGFNKMKFIKGDKLKYHASCNQTDIARLQKAITEAQAQSDYIIVSIHAHQTGGATKETVPEFLSEFAHTAIDMGAHAVIGHGPHLLRPLEIYSGRPIFYSLGDFMLHNESFGAAPEDFFEKYKLTSDDPLCEVYRKRSRGYTCGLLTDSRMLEAVVPYFEFDDGKLTKLELMPIELGFDKPRYRTGDPVFCPDKGIIERYAEMSAPYGTRITVDENGFGTVVLD